jgi:hypothetical protein
MCTREKLTQLRSILVPLVESFELEDVDRGLVAWVPVVGGTFLHPLTREPIKKFKVYGAGSEHVKIVEPKFLRSLGRVAVSGLSHPSHLCARVAQELGAILEKLGKIRNELIKTGAQLELDEDMLQLRGHVRVFGINVELNVDPFGHLKILALENRTLCDLDASKCSLHLNQENEADMAALSNLVQSIDEMLKEKILDPVGQELDASQKQEEPDEGEDSDVMELTELVEEVCEVSPEPIFDSIAKTRPQIPVASEPSSSQTQFPALPQRPASPPFVPSVNDLSEGRSGPRVCTKSGPDGEQTDDSKSKISSASSSGETQEVSFAPLRLDFLIDIFGNESEISVCQDRLWLKVPCKVVQGDYTFYLEQVEPKLFKGVLVSPGGNRHNVDVDLTRIMDIKEIFDRVMLSR